MNTLKINELKKYSKLNIWDTPVEPVEYAEIYMFEIPSKYKLENKGSWYVTNRGIIRTMLLGPEQEPHNSDGSSYGESRLVPIFGIISHSRGMRWARVEFKRTLKSIKSIVATILDPPRLDKMPEETIQRFSIPRIELPDIPRIEIWCFGCNNNDCRYGWFALVLQPGNIVLHGVIDRCPKCGTTDITRFTESDRFEKVMKHRAEWSWRQRLGNWWILNPLRDAIANTIVWLEYDVFGLDGAFMPVNLIVSYVDQMWRKLEEFRNDLQDVLNNTVNKELEHTETSINNVFIDIYSAWGMLRNMVNPPTFVRNITNRGFEVYIPYENCRIAVVGFGIR